MEHFENLEYLKDVERVSNLCLPWEKLQGKGVLISGASGMLGSFLVDVLMLRNRKMGMECRVFAVGRNEHRAKSRFRQFWQDSMFDFIPWDVSHRIEKEITGRVDYVLHLASNTHPVAYATEPIQTITTNILGTYNLLEFAAAKRAERFLLASSCEIYGENRGDVEKFDESYCGYIDCNTMRAGYPESKRCSEALCQAYRRQKGMDIVIPRLARCYGPTLLESDTKALSQFLHKAAQGEDIVLKSEGTQYYSYLHASDAVSGMLAVLLLGKDGEAYNISDESSDIRLRDLAAIIAKESGRKVVFELSDAVEAAGYSKATKARLDSGKLKALGWKPYYDIECGLRQTIGILREPGEMDAVQGNS